MNNPQRFLLIVICAAIGVVGLMWSVSHKPRSSSGTQVQIRVTPPVEWNGEIATVDTNPSLLPAGDEKTQPEIGTQTPPQPQLPVRQGNNNQAPLIAIVIDDVGLDLKDSQRAVALPAYVTLSYMPYATRLREQTESARGAGHELMLHMPMEPLGHDDPGPGALLTGLPPDELRQRFDTALASFVGFDGVNNHMGSKFTADQTGMELVMDELAPRQLFFLDSRTSAHSVGFETARRKGISSLSRDVFLDDDMALSAVQRQLEQVEHIARRKGYVIAIGHPHPATLQALEQWLPQAQAAGFVFVPLHDLMQQPMARPD